MVMVTGSTDHRMYNRKHNETQQYVKKQIVYPDIGNLQVKGNIIVVETCKEKQFNKELANFSVLTSLNMQANSY